MLHATLSKRLFDAADSTHPVLRQVHRDWIMRNVLGNAHGSVVLSGELAGYDYEDNSELALTLITDHADRAELAQTLASRLDGVRFPGTNYPVQTFVLPGTLQKHALYKEDIRAGYDVGDGMWITPPQYALDIARDHYAYALECEDKLELLADQPRLARRFARRLKEGGPRQKVAFAHLAEEHKAPQYSKFVYHPDSNKLIIGPMAAEEGENIHHMGLAQMAGFPHGSNMTFGQVREDGRGELFGRPKIQRFDPKQMNQYMADHLTGLAVKHALPDADFAPVVKEPPKHWQLPGPPEVMYSSDPPVIARPATEQVDDDEWSFG